MFIIGEGSFDQRRDLILRHAKLDTEVGFLLSMINFEWTLRRSVLVLGRAPTKELRHGVLSNASGPKDYKRAWKFAQAGCEGLPSLCQIFNGEGEVPFWNIHKKGRDGILQAFMLRHKLVHGCVSKPGDNYMWQRISLMLEAAYALEMVAKSYGKDLNSRTMRIVPLKKKNRIVEIKEDIHE